MSQNRAVLRFNIHYAIQAFAQSAGGVFVFVYFLRAGFSAAAARWRSKAKKP